MGDKLKKHLEDHPEHAIGAGVAGAAGAAGLGYLATRKKKSKKDDDEKTAAYYEGVLERAREYGFSDHDAVQIVKAASVGRARDPRVAAALEAFKTQGFRTIRPPKGEADILLQKARIAAMKNRALLAGGAGLIGGVGLTSALSGD
jgi:hypothetical protein